MADLFHRASSFLFSLPGTLPPSLRQPSNNVRLTVSALSATILAVTVPRIYRDYKTFLSYGPGGVPYNFLGWFGVSVIMRPWAREMLSTEPYNHLIAAGETTSYLTDEVVQGKKRDRPEVGPHIAPQRQLTEFPPEEIKKKLDADFYALASRNQHLIKLSPSHVELHADAFFLADGLSPSPIAQQMKGEIAHIHHLKDFSLHLTLAPADCKKIIENGWGQRHKLSGVKIPRALFAGRDISIPLEYVFIYAPRTEEEVAFVMEIVVASVKFMTGAVEVR
ncbi:hypothetical protein BDV25DRAFT_132073 [Aspergillus avenaceus]|uniref:Luciferase domain-containing protein n=1 Tax=Aspergillus avenaceus TaxID=36643 RepID=A0A5N6TM84_ASPAV|nr:hypothetical protein BDV25DRAFT_132073 [Aspergillus avenaceus]